MSDPIGRLRLALEDEAAAEAAAAGAAPPDLVPGTASAVDSRLRRMSMSSGAFVPFGRLVWDGSSKVRRQVAMEIAVPTMRLGRLYHFSPGKTQSGEKGREEVSMWSERVVGRDGRGVNR